MTERATPHRLGRLSFAMIVASITTSAAASLAMDFVLIQLTTDVAGLISAVVLFNGATIMLSVVGGIIEWRRPGHAIGRLMMLAGPMYAIASAGWTTINLLQPLIEPMAYQVFSWTVLLLSWSGMALIIGWIPLLFPTGTLPGPRWRAPAALTLTLLGVGHFAMALRPGGYLGGPGYMNPFGVDWWPVVLQPFVDAIPLAVLASLVLGVAGVITRYRRGSRIVRLQIRWFATAVALVPLSGVAILIEVALREAGGAGADAPNALITVPISYAVVLALPIAIGIAVTRYRLYEIDRLISRTIGWTLVTGVLLAVFGGTVIGLQAILDRFMQGQTLAVAASTLIAFALFQPVRRRVQALVDHRFDRARYDGDRTAAAFAERLRGQVDLAGLEADIAGVVDGALRPTTVGVWIRRPGHRGAA